MSIWESIVLGIIQGLTEFLPVSSSGHIELGKAIFGINESEAGLLFTVTLHFATALKFHHYTASKLLKDDQFYHYHLKMGE